LPWLVYRCSLYLILLHISSYYFIILNFNGGAGPLGFSGSFLLSFGGSAGDTYNSVKYNIITNERSLDQLGQQTGRDESAGYMGKKRGLGTAISQGSKIRVMKYQRWLEHVSIISSPGLCN
jgi:hypothetical protein